MKNRYGDAIERAEIAMENFYNGGCPYLFIFVIHKNICLILGLEPHAVAYSQ